MWSPLSRQTPADLHIAFHERPGLAQRWEAMADDERAAWLTWCHEASMLGRGDLLARSCYLADLLSARPIPAGMTPGKGFDESD